MSYFPCSVDITTLSCALNTGLHFPRDPPAEECSYEKSYVHSLEHLLCKRHVHAGPDNLSGLVLWLWSWIGACVAAATELLCSGACRETSLTKRRVLPLPAVKGCDPFWALPLNGGSFFATKSIVARRPPASPDAHYGDGWDGLKRTATTK